MQNRKYRITNWTEYNQSLIKRGSLTIWIGPDSLKKWLCTSCTGIAGRPPTYSDDAILMLLVLRERFNLPLRALEGFVKSIFLMMGISLPVPSYTQISRRAASLHQQLLKLSPHKAKDLIFDSTGLKVQGEGEWKVRVHGKSKRRTWKKFHIGIDAKTQDIMMCELTDSGKADADIAGQMLDRYPYKINSTRGDGAYDRSCFRKASHRKSAQPIVPPPRNATYKGAKDGWRRIRDATLAEIEGLGGGDLGRKLWKKLSGYHKRSLVETSMFRIKKMMGDRLKGLSTGSQRTEIICKCLVINKFNELGLPKGKWV